MLEAPFLAARRAAPRLGLSPPRDPNDDVVLLPWPAGDTDRTALARAGVPRLLVLEPGAPPPDEWDELEDWVRGPLDPEEVAFRQHALRDRLLARAGGLRIDDGLLRRGDRWVPLTDVQLAVTRSLLAQAGRVVQRDDLLAVFTGAGGSATPTAFPSCLKRLRERLRELHVTVHTMSEGRLMLEVEPAPAPEEARLAALR